MAAQHRLPLFPLDQVLYPNERLPLHIFEPRYKDLTTRCLDQDEPFGIVLMEDEQLGAMGCTANIKEVLKEYENGELDILVTGKERFEVLAVHESDSYLTADVTYVDEAGVSASSELRERVITLHMKLLELAGHKPRPSLYEDAPDISYLLAQNAGMNSRQQQQLLELITPDDRLAYLIEYFGELLPRVEEEGRLQRKVRSNGHFKDFPSVD